MLLHNVVVVNEGEAFAGYVLTEGEMIAAVGHGEPPAMMMDNAEVVDGHGRLLLPGVIDTHVHFRDPGLTHKADMATESVAAVTGGVTSFIDMPNTRPATVTREALEAKLKRGAEVSTANYGFFIGATADNLDELVAPTILAVPVSSSLWARRQAIC